MDVDHKVILEYLRVFLSTQVVTLAVVTTFLLLFRNQISNLLNRIASIKVGSAELLTPQQPSEVSESVTLTTAAVPATSNEPEADDGGDLVHALQSETYSALIWEFRYLNYFFVESTQRVLAWLVNLPQPQTIRTYDVFWQTFIPSAEQRATILDVLKNHWLVEVVGPGGLIRVTDKGRSYVGWRGQQPSAQADTTAPLGDVLNKLHEEGRSPVQR